MENYTQQLQPIFEKISTKLGQTAHFSWEIAVKQQIIYGWTGLICVIIGIGFMIYAARINYKSEKYNEPNLFSLSVFFSFLAFCMIIGGFIIGVLRLVNPEYYALQFFLNSIK